MYKLYTDAATSHQDNDKSAGGVLILNQGKQNQFKYPLTAHDNHTAEFQICIIGFRELLKLVPQNDLEKTIVSFYTDSKIVADSLNKQYAKHYQPLVDEIIQLENNFQLVMNQWVPESHNMGAHQLAQQALHYFK
ncbi:ribonuclease HI family protein [Lactobacillaceae bacterium Scapto_B20]